MIDEDSFITRDKPRITIREDLIPMSVGGYLSYYPDYHQFTPTLVTEKSSMTIPYPGLTLYYPHYLVYLDLQDKHRLRFMSKVKSGEVKEEPSLDLLTNSAKVLCRSAVKPNQALYFNARIATTSIEEFKVGLIDEQCNNIDNPYHNSHMHNSHNIPKHLLWEVGDNTPFRPGNSDVVTDYALAYSDYFEAYQHLSKEFFPCVNNHYQSLLDSDTGYKPTLLSLFRKLVKAHSELIKFLNIDFKDLPDLRNKIQDMHRIPNSIDVTDFIFDDALSSKDITDIATTFKELIALARTKALTRGDFFTRDNSIIFPMMWHLCASTYQDFEVAKSARTHFVNVLPAEVNNHYLEENKYRAQSAMIEERTNCSSPELHAIYTLFFLTRCKEACIYSYWFARFARHTLQKSDPDLYLYVLSFCIRSYLRGLIRMHINTLSCIVTFMRNRVYTLYGVEKLDKLNDLLAEIFAITEALKAKRSIISLQLASKGITCRVEGQVFHRSGISRRDVYDVGPNANTVRPANVRGLYDSYDDNCPTVYELNSYNSRSLENRFHEFKFTVLNALKARSDTAERREI